MHAAAVVAAAIAYPRERAPSLMVILGQSGVTANVARALRVSRHDAVQDVAVVVDGVDVVRRCRRDERATRFPPGIE